MNGVNSSSFVKPLPLLISENRSLVLKEETAEILAAITQPVVVVAIAGKYRTGKSYILNLLSNLPRGSGFELGDTVESLTKGIWVYALPHPKIKDTTLLLLDTEGLGDVDKGDITYDTTLLVLTILLSSTFILNVTGRLDDEVITQLGFVSTLTKNMKTKNTDFETGDDFDLFFPQLVVLVRDFCLELIINGQEVSANEYFNNYCLQIKDKAAKNSAQYNEPRRLIRKYFPKRSCVTLPMPVCSRKLLRKLEEVPDSKLNPEFLDESTDFIKMILKISEPKTLTEKARVNGSILVTLLRNYLEQIKNGAVPCIETTLQSTARVENEKLLLEFIGVYKEKMREVLNLPTSLQFITEMHQTMCHQLTEEFKQRIIFDDDKNEMENKYTKEVNNAFNEILRENEEASKQECESRLRQLSATLNKKLDEKIYYRPGGYNEYSKDLHDVIEAYNNVPDKGVKHEEVLCKFVANRYREGNQISTLDEQMTDSEKKAEAARIEKEHAEQIAKMQQEHAEQARKAQEEMKKTFEETQIQLQRELEERNKKHDELLKILAERSKPPPRPKKRCVIS
uniref:Interferon-induced guanylate-binding protein 1 n=1 Tax=Hemiscolopendra marginata TaxID=943146 RepID=A0A646QCI3_9MYRI